MRLVYTYNEDVYSDINKKNRTLEYYIESINRARKLGYKIELYTNSNLLSPLVDKVNLIESHNSYLWDSFKFIALEDPNTDYSLIDGDVFLNKRLDLFTTDVVVDTIELGNWNILYNKTVKTLTNLRIHDHIPEWDGSFQKVFGCGLLYFNDAEFRRYYVESWNILNNFIILHKDKINLYYATAVAAQYLLTLLVNKHGKSYNYYSKVLGAPNKFYVHHAGKDKYKGDSIFKNKLV